MIFFLRVTISNLLVTVVSSNFFSTFLLMKKKNNYFESFIVRLSITRILRKRKRLEMIVNKKLGHEKVICLI